MKVKIIAGFYDADLRRIVEKDETQDFSDEKAKKYIAKHLAVKMEEPKKPEPKKKPASKKEK